MMTKNMIIVEVECPICGERRFVEAALDEVVPLKMTCKEYDLRLGIEEGDGDA
jgi:hypothetical protein